MTPLLRPRALALCLAAFAGGGALTGCATVRPQAAFDGVEAALDGRTEARVVWRTDARTGADADRAIDSLLAAPLTPDAAAQVALLANRRLQAAYEDIGVAQADLVQAGLLANPLLGAGLRFPLGDGGAPDAHVSIAASVVSALTRPRRQAIARSGVEAARLRVAATVLAHEAATRSAVYRAQADAAHADLQRAVVANAEASHRAAVLLREAGNVTAAAVLAEQARFEQARLDLVTASATAAASRERLVRAMGVFGSRAAFTLAGPLAPVPDATSAASGTPAPMPGLAMPGMTMPGAAMRDTPMPGVAMPDATTTGAPTTGAAMAGAMGMEADATDAAALEAQAVAASLALAAARFDVAMLGRRLGLADVTALLPDVEVGAELERRDGELELGPDIEVRLPLFDQGQARRARARAELRRAQARYYALAVEVRAAARMQARRLDASRAAALHYQRVVLPLRARLTRETLLQYNAMQVGVFGLLDVQQAEAAASRRYLDRLADYWRARADVALLRAGGMPDDGSPASEMGGSGAMPPEGAAPDH